MRYLKEFLFTLGGFIGSMIVKFIGGWSKDFETLLWFMVFDYIIGVIAAGVFHVSPKTKNGRLESSAGLKGLCKKLFMLFMVSIGYHLDILLCIDYVRTTIIIGLILNELLSIIESWGLIGLPLPNILIEAVEILKKKTERGK